MINFAGQNCRFLVFLSLLVFALGGELRYLQDPNRFQTIKFTVYSSSTPLAAPGTTLYRFAFLQRFQGVPDLFLGIMGLEIGNSSRVQFQLSNNKLLSQSQGEVALWVGPTTLIYKFKANTFATFALFVLTQRIVVGKPFSNGDNSAGQCQNNCNFTQRRQAPLSIVGLDYSTDPTQPGRTLQISVDFYSKNLTYGSSINLTKIIFHNREGYTNPLAPSYNQLSAGLLHFGSQKVEIRRNETYGSHFMNNFLSTSIVDMSTINNAGSKFPANDLVTLSGLKLLMDYPFALDIVSKGVNQQTALYFVYSERGRLGGSIWVSFWSYYLWFCEDPLDNLLITASYQAVCQPCPGECLTCINELCSSCNDSSRTLQITNMATGGGICVCPMGTYGRSPTSCASCDAGCVSCTGSSWNCSACLPGYLFIGNRCMFPCFIISSRQLLQTCSICPEGCAVCSSSSSCDHTLCQNSTQLYYNGSCDDTCPDGLYPDRGVCLKCKDQCLTCSNYTTCNSCIDGFYLDGSSCGICYATCLTCHGNASTDCDTCKSGQLTGGKCFPPTYDSGNNSNTVIYDSFVVCDERYFYNKTNKQCQACSPGCTQCADPTFCYRCSGEFILTGSTCEKCSSLTGFAYNQILNQCEEVCGDGKKLYQQCDDGNSIGGDGCSSACVVEQGYYCLPTLTEDLCIKAENQITVKMNKSIMANNLKVSIISESGIFKSILNLPSLNCTSPQKKPSQIDVSTSKTQTTLEYSIDFNESLQNHQCSCHIGVGLSLNFEVNTSPKSYLVPAIILEQVDSLSILIESLSYVCLFLAFFNHLFNFASTAVFFQHSCLFIACLLQTQYVPSYLYRITLGLKHLIVIMNKDYLQDFYGLNYVYGVYNHINVSLRGIIIFLLILVLTAILMRVLQHYHKINQQVQVLFKGMLADQHIYIYQTFKMYEPIIIVYVILSPKTGLDGLDYLTYICIFGICVFTVYAAIRYTFFKPNKFLKSSSILKRVRSCFFSVGVAFSKTIKDLGQLPTLFALLLTLSIVIYDLSLLFSKHCQSTKTFESHGLFWRRTNSVRTEVSSMDKLRCLLKYTYWFQSIYNGLFFIVQCLNILVVYYSGSQQTILNRSGMVSIGNLVLFLAVNICCMVMQLAFRISKAFFSDSRPTIEPTPEPTQVEPTLDVSTQHMSVALSKHQSSNFGNPADILGDYRVVQEPNRIVIKGKRRLKESIRQQIEIEDESQQGEVNSLQQNDIVLI